MGQLKVPKPKAIIMDMMGTMVKSAFIDKVLMPYIEANVKQYIEEKWEDKDVKKDVEALRKESNSSELKIVGSDAEVAQQKQSVVDYIMGQIAAKKAGKALMKFRYHMWFDGFTNGKIQTPIYSDVAIQVRKWKDSDIKLYVLSNSWIELTKKFMGKTSHGDLSLMLDDYFDSTSMGALTSKDTYVKLCTKLSQPPDQVLFMTKSTEEARAAKEAGLPICLVLTHRRNIEKLTEEEKAMPRIRSFNELELDSTAG